ncbi:MAG: phosphatase PAP2 family protein [Fimbriimonadales bacterium]|nr:phosphatase PAP2 family protein [Fimbriimonadales bacterium]
MLELVRQADLELFRTVHLAWRHPWLDPVFLALSYTGLGQVQLLAVAASLWRFPAARPYWRHLLGAFAVSGLLNSLLKDLFGRERPSLLAWSQPQEPFQYASFPSGHTVTSFALAVFAWLMLRGKFRWSWLLVLWAGAVAVSRIYRGVHWPSDVLAAAALGSAVGACFAWLADSRRRTVGAAGARAD